MKKDLMDLLTELFILQGIKGGLLANYRAGTKDHLTFLYNIPVQSRKLCVIILHDFHSSLRQFFKIF